MLDTIDVEGAIEDRVERLALIRAELRRRRWRLDPERWARERLGDTLWSKQGEILRSVLQFRRTAVQSCHAIGKSYIAAIIIAWWIDIHKAGDAFAVTSAPTAAQVRAILWREIGRVHARGLLGGYVNQTEWRMDMPLGNNEAVAFGRKPDDYDTTAFQGIHAPAVLLVFDEATGIPIPLWIAGDSLVANDQSKVLAIGNPDDSVSEFHEVCKPGSGYNVIQVSAFESPNFTGEPLPDKIKQQLIGRIYVEERRRKWAPQWYWVDRNGERCAPEVGVKVVPPPDVNYNDAVASTNPYWQSKILGVFPPVGHEGGLIPLQWIRAAQQRVLEPGDPNELGTDVGGGGDSSTIAHRLGGVVRIIHEDHNPDTMQTCGNVVYYLKKTGATSAKVDVIGIGRGVVDRGKELLHPFEGVNVGEAADEPEFFINRRAELYWNLRERFEQGTIDIDEFDEETAAELVEIRFKRLSSGKIQVESKDDMKRRGVMSPNRADAVMLAFAPPRDVETSATWGR